MGELFDENGEADAKALLFGLLKSAERANKPRRAKRARGADRDSGGRENKIEALEKQMKAMQRELERLQEDNRP